MINSNYKVFVFWNNKLFFDGCVGIMACSIICLCVCIDEDKCKNCNGTKIVRDRKILEVSSKVLG